MKICVVCLFIALSMFMACGVLLNTTEKEGYCIVLSITGNSGGKGLLALQKTDKILVIDSLPFFSKGNLCFRGKKSLLPGQYTYIQNGRRLFNFLISFEQRTDLHFIVSVENGRTIQLVAQGDRENSAYMEFQRFIQNANRNPNISRTDVEKIDRYTDSIAKCYPNTLLEIIANNISKPPLPKHLALHDRRILHTSILPIRLQSLFTNIVPAQLEYVIPQIDSILLLATDPLVKEWCGEFLLNYFLSSDIMGMENASVYIAKKYLAGEIKSNDAELLTEIANYVSFNEHALLGMTAPDLFLYNAEGQKISLLNLKADYTILLFYDHECPLCREHIPEIESIYKQYQAKNIMVFAVYTQDRFEEWQRYVQTLNREWIHVWDPNFSSGFHRLYNVTGTPKIYLLDQNKTIIGRGVDAIVLKKILSHYIN